MWLRDRRIPKRRTNMVHRSRSEGSVAGPSDRRPLHRIEEAATLEARAREHLEGIFRFVRGEAQGLELHEVERGVFRQLLALGRLVIEAFLAKKGTGKQEEPVTLPDGRELRYHGTKKRQYFSIFGMIEVVRAYYWRNGAPGVLPLDEELNLPERRYSYLLQEWGELLGVQGAFDKVTELLETLLRVKFWKQGVELVAKEVSSDVQPFYEDKGAPDGRTEAEVLVAAVDGKGVPIRRETPQARKLHLSKGDKANRKKESVVTTVYTIRRDVRRPGDVVRQIRNDGTVVAEKKRKRPSPKNKRVRATLRGKEAAFAEVRRQFEERDPSGKKERLVLTDGAEALHRKAKEMLAGVFGFVLILDIMHVLGYLWTASYAFHKEGSAEAARWVMHRLELLLEGKAGYVIGGLRQSITKHELTGRKRAMVHKAIGYMAKNREYMAYDVYLAKGYPIGTGVVEGACRSLVKDRMEGPGMRWSMDGAQAILELRAVQMNGDWEKFWEYRVARERERLYPLKKAG